MRLSISAVALFLPLIACAANKPFQDTPESAKGYRAETLMEDQGDVLWGFDFLPSREVLLTKRSGELIRWNPVSKAVTKIKNVPEVFARGQGGLLDVRVHPNYETNRWIFISYAKPFGSGATTAVGRAELKGDELVNFKDIFVAQAVGRQTIHFGSRIEFSKEGYLFVSVGDRNEREKAQSLAAHNGKILRITAQGKSAPGNPFAERTGALAEIWSYGHRNPQGLATHPETGKLWAVEMGPQGGDEINLIEPGKNYGWPLVTYGEEYGGGKIGSPRKEGTVQPAVHYVPSISPSGAAFYRGNIFPQWKYSLFLANLSGVHLRRVELRDGAVAEQEVLFEGYARFRNVRTGPDGLLYFSTDDGRFAKLVPVN